MKYEQTERLVKHLYDLSAKSIYVPILLWGESGVGKSMCVRRLTEQLNIGFVDLRLGHQEVGDLIGLPREETVYPCSFCHVAGCNGKHYTKPELLAHIQTAHVKHDLLAQLADPADRLKIAISEAQKSLPHLIDVRMTHSRPDWFPDSGSGIIFLDELNRGHLEVRQAVFQLVLDRRMHTHVLPPRWIIASAVNPSTEDYQADELYDKAFIARFLHVSFEPDAPEWLAYAASKGIDWTIRAAISEDAKLLGQDTPKMPKIRPTPRTWNMLSDLMTDGGLPHDVSQEVAAGLVGAQAAAAWLKIVNSPDRPVKANEILRDYDKARSRVKRYATSKEARFDLLKVSMDDLATTLDARQDGMTDVESDHLAAFILDCPKDLSYAYLKMRFTRNPKLRKKLSARDDLYDLVSKINKDCGIQT